MPYKTGIRLLGVARNPANGFPARLLETDQCICGSDFEIVSKQWLSHAQMISWEAAKHSKIGLTIDYLKQDDDLWQSYWRLYCLQRLAIADKQKLYESDCASLTLDAS